MTPLKTCPFCGRKLKFFRNTYINKNGKQITEQYYMHDYSDDGEECLLDKLMMPFVLGSGDADPEKGLIGEYAELWNRRVEK